MPMFTVPFDDFGGLDLTSAANETGGAIDLLNVDFDKSGRVRSRDGYTQLSAGSGDVISALIGQGAAGNFVALGANKVARAYNSAGTLLASSAALAQAAQNLTSIGTATNSYVYGGTGDALGHTLRWDGAAWAYPVTGYSAYFAAVTPWDNRLVLANENSPTTDGSRVRFSDPGVPDTFGANNYIDLTPGDDQVIVAMCAWRNQLFVFKRTKFFVFYGTTADATGQPVFNYRTVDAGQGAGVFSGAERSGDCVAMNDGVYFSNANGVFRTTGGPPAKISGPVDPAFFIGSADYFLGTFANGGGVSMTRFRQRLMWSQGTTPYQLVYDTERGTWTYWTLPASCFLEYTASVGGTPVPMFGTRAGTINKMTPGVTTDNGANITSRYRSAFIPLDWRGRNLRSGIHGVDKTVRESLLEGSGTVTYSLANQWVAAGAVPTGATVTLGTSPQVAMGRDRRAVRGRMFSWRISATGPWSLETLSWNVYGYEDPGEASETT